MRVNVVGAGALGGYYGAMLARSGAEVHFLLHSDYDAVAARGLEVRSIRGDFRLPRVHAYRDPAAMPKAQCVLVGLKTTQNDLYEPLIAPMLAPESWVCTLQNGLGNEDRLAELFGPQRVAGGVAFLCSNRVAPGVIEHSNYGAVVIGEFARPASDRVRELARLFVAAGVPCDVTDRLLEARWRKQVWNVPFNAISTLAGADTQRIVTDPELRALVEAVMREVQAAARAQGVEIPDAFLADRMAATDRMGPYRTSMLLDHLAGRPLEVESIVGAALRAARAANVPAPATHALYALLRCMHSAGSERGER